MYDFTKVSRRINTWCDLALVAGFAEGRHEIDGEFIDLVISAQGVGLEGVDESLISKALDPLLESSESQPHSPSNGLDLTIRELSVRLTRLEGLMLEMSGDLIPFFTKGLVMPSELPGETPPRHANNANPLYAKIIHSGEFPAPDGKMVVTPMVFLILREPVLFMVDSGRWGACPSGYESL